jgi:hypothetical protein
MTWVKELVRAYDLADQSVLEVGSYNENGSVRELFTGSYLGVDSQPGPGVDEIRDGENLGTEQFEVVISTEMLEHCRRPWKVMEELARVSSHYVIITARGFDAERGAFFYHAYPYDFWRFGPDVLANMAEDVGLMVEEFKADPQAPGWFLLATRKT